MYVGVKGGETAVKNSRKLIAKIRRGPETIAETTPEQIENQFGLAVDRVMAEGALYDPKAAARAIRQSQGDLVEAGFLVRAFRTTLKRFGNSKPVNTEKMKILRRISGAYKDIPGGQILGPTYDYTHRLIDFEDGPESTTGLQKNQDMAEAAITEYENFMPRVVDMLIRQGLMNLEPGELIGEKIEDLTRQPLKLPAKRSIRLQALARGDEGFLLGSAYSLQNGFGLDRHPFLCELRVGYVDIMVTPPELGFIIKVGEIKVTECFMINRNNGSHQNISGFENGYGLVFGWNERKALSISLLDRSLQNSEKEADEKYPAQSQEFILSHCDNVESSGFVQHLKLPHYVDFQSELVFIRNLRKKHRKDRTKPESQ